MDRVWFLVLSTIMLGIVAWGLFLYYIPDVIQRPVGIERIFERPSSYGIVPPSYDKDILAGYAASPSAKHYASVLFPWDFIMMAAMTLFFMVGSLTLIEFGPPWAKTCAVWWFILPLLYFVADLAEDGLLYGFMQAKWQVTNIGVLVLKSLTVAKLVTIYASMLQLVGLGAGAAWSLLGFAGRQSGA